MITFRLLACLVLLINFVACSSSNVATTSYRGGFDFSSVESYSTYGRNSAFGELQNLSDITRNTIELAIEQNFDSNGFSYKTLKKADIFIAYHVISNNLSELELYNKEVKYCAYCLRVGQASRRDLLKKLQPGSLVLDIIDAKNQRSVWRSVHPLRFKEKDNSREIQEKINDAIDRMLKDYPKGQNLSQLLNLTETFS